VGVETNVHNPYGNWVTIETSDDVRILNNNIESAMPPTILLNAPVNTLVARNDISSAFGAAIEVVAGTSHTHIVGNELVGAVLDAGSNTAQLANR